MIARADIVARITARVQFITGAAPGSIAHDKSLIGMAAGTSIVDSLDLTDIEIDVEDEFGLGIGELDLPRTSTIDSIADAVIAAST